MKRARENLPSKRDTLLTPLVREGIVKPVAGKTAGSANAGSPLKSAVCQICQRFKKKDVYSLCPRCRKTFCEVCLQPMKGHGRCEACRIYVGLSHLTEKVSDFRGHQLCEVCLKSWEQQAKQDWATFSKEDSIRGEGTKETA